MNEPWTIRKVLGWTAQHFEKHDVDSPRLTAEVLLAHTLDVDRVRLYIDLDRPLEQNELVRFKSLIAQRAQGSPTQYLTGVREFYSRPIRVDSRVLIPRPETELLVEAVLRDIPADAPARVLDLCTGSGCIASTIAKERPQAQVWATDISPGACAVARDNAPGVTVLEGDLFEALPADLTFDVVVSNPPYIATDEIDGLSREVRAEPRNALDGGPGGLEIIRRIVELAPARMNSNALLALEIGESQGAAVQALLETAGYRDVRIEKDLARLDRMAFGRR